MRLCAFLACLLLAAPLAAQTPKSAAESGIEQHLRSRTGVVSNRVLDGASTLEQWKERLPRLRRDYLDMVGLWPLPEKTPLKSTVTGTVARGDVVIEKLHFQSMPGLYVTGNLYRPKEAKKPLPAILYVCGHSGRGRDGNKTAFQDHGMWFARNGYVCLIIDTLQLGEVKGVHHGTYNLGRWWWHSLAYTPAGVECWNGVRAIDYLVSRKDVDADKIGVTGISGGGAVTIWIAAADQRVKVAVPVSGMSDLKSYVNDKVVNGHCDCMFLVNLYGWEWTTIAALIAPRPMLFANSDKDPIFPMDGNRRIIARLRQLYKLYDKPDLVDEYVSVGGHDYRADLRVAIFGFINKHLKGDNSTVKDADDKPLPGKELRAFAEDADLPKDSINDRIDESFIKPAKVAIPDAKDFVEWKTNQIRKLRDTSFRAFPAKLPRGTAISATIETRKDGLRGQAFYPEWDVHAFLSLPVHEERSRKGMLVVLGEADAEKHAVPEWVKELSKDHEVRLFVPRGTGSMNWARKNPPNYVERATWLLGETVDQGRVRDVVAAVKWLQEDNPSREWSVAGRGQAGVLAAYAALFEPSIAGVIAADPPASHKQGPHFLGVLRVLDVPEAMGLIAPRPLTLAGKVDEAFVRTTAIYASAGASSKLTSPHAAKQARIDPAGLPGYLLLVGSDFASEEMTREFLRLCGGEKALIAVLATDGKPIHPRILGPLADVKNRLTTDLKKATAVVVVGNESTANKDTLSACQAVLQRGGFVTAIGPVAASIGGALLGDARIEIGAAKDSTLPAAISKERGRIGVQIPLNGTLLIRGRTMAGRGEGSVSFHLAASKDRPAAKITLEQKRFEDLTRLRRAARDRAENYPPAKVPSPVVEKGTLVIIGGGGMPAGMISKFVELAGGKKAHIVVLPTAVPNPNLKDRIVDVFRKAGAAKVTVLPGKKLADVESAESLAALKEATGIWFGGGRQWHFVDAYELTQALPLMHDVLKRGGVIGGSSAGATIQGEYLCRGGVFNNFAIMYEGYERGFNFLPGVAIDQHFAQRKRFADMTAMMKTFPQYLGIGIDEATAIIVQGSVAEVVGRGKVHFYDCRKPVEKGKPDHESLEAGAKYDLKERKVVKGS